jgi:hypothetical protein
MKWSLDVKMKYKSYKVEAEIIDSSPSKEKISVVGYWGRRLVLQNNRPLFIKKGLKHRRWKWEIVEGNVKYSSFIEELVKELELVLRGLN